MSSHTFIQPIENPDLHRSLFESGLKFLRNEVTGKNCTTVAKVAYASVYLLQMIL